MHILFIERLNILCMWIFYKVHRIFQVQRLRNKSFSFHFSSFPLVLLTRVDVFLFLQCSVSCGEGTRQRSVECKLETGQLSPGCDERIRPSAKEACNIRPCPTWMTGEWGKVSGLIGLIFREFQSILDKFKRVNYLSTIVSLLWQCSVTCGSGVNFRSVECSDEDIQCDIRTKPRNTQRCDLRACPRWITGQWGQARQNLLIICHFLSKRSN